MCDELDSETDLEVEFKKFETSTGSYHPVRSFSSVKNTCEHLKNSRAVMDQDEPELNLSSSSSEQEWSLLGEGSLSNKTDSTHKGVCKGQLCEVPGGDQPESSPESNQTSPERPEKSNDRSSLAPRPDEGQNILNILHHQTHKVLEASDFSNEWIVRLLMSSFYFSLHL